MNWHHKHQQTMSRSDGIAEWVARRIGSMTSIIAHTVAFIAGFEAVALGEIALPDRLLWLTTIVSLEAIYIGLFLRGFCMRIAVIADIHGNLPALEVVGSSLRSPDD